MINIEFDENCFEIDEENPIEITEKIDEIITFDKLMKEASENSEIAKVAADNQIVAKKHKTEESINTTQDAVKALAMAQISIVEAQKSLFENQQKMADSIKFLLMVGASSIASNKLVIKELETKLNTASKESLSESARQELVNLVKMLKEQETTFAKQERLSTQIKETAKIVEEQGKEIEEANIINERQTEKDKEHDIQINKQKEVDKVHDKEIQKIKLFSYIGLVIGTAALILAIIHFFI